MLFEQIRANKRRTIVLLLAFFVLLTSLGAAVGYLLAGSWQAGVFMALLLGLIYAISMIFQGTNVVMSMNNAREVTASEFPDLYHVVEDMAMVAQIPMPRVFVIDEPALNAFATGSSPQEAAVAATTGLLSVMTREELEAVMGHEVSHIRHYDIRLSTIAVALTSVVGLLASLGSRSMWYGGSSRRDERQSTSGHALFLLLSLVAIALAPLAATLVQLAISRQREFLADAGAVALTRNPQGMIKALRKLDQSVPMSREVDPASSAIYIYPPKMRDGVKSLFRTHPPIAERIARLESM